MRWQEDRQIRWQAPSPQQQYATSLAARLRDAQKPTGKLALVKTVHLIEVANKNGQIFT